MLSRIAVNLRKKIRRAVDHRRTLHETRHGIDEAVHEYELFYAVETAGRGLDIREGVERANFRSLVRRLNGLLFSNLPDMGHLAVVRADRARQIEQIARA